MRRATVRLDLAGDLPLAEADAVQIQQVLLNLMRNGVEAMNGCSAADDGISVRTCAGENREIEVSVADRGPGLPAAAAGDPFRAFFTTKESGMGMGLSISQSIVTAHGGRIWFRRDERDSETTFAFTLPAADAERA